MKISRIFLPFQLALEALTAVLHPENNRTNSSPVLLPVRVKEADRFAMMRANRRSNQRNNIL